MKKMMSGVLVVAAMMMTACGGVTEEDAAQVDETGSVNKAIDCGFGWCKYDSQCGTEGVCYQGRCACI